MNLTDKEKQKLSNAYLKNISVWDNVNKYYTFYCPLHNMMQKEVGKIMGNYYDMQEMYSLANETFAKALNSYDVDQTIPFKVFLKGCLDRKIKTFIRDSNRKKRMCPTSITSLDAAIGDSEDSTMHEIVPNKEESCEYKALRLDHTEEFDNYYSKLDSKQKKICDMICDGFNLKFIKNHLGMSDAQFNDLIEDMRGYSKSRLLYNLF